MSACGEGGEGSLYCSLLGIWSRSTVDRLQVVFGLGCNKGLSLCSKDVAGPLLEK
uniref:Uncharacterized protein n=1 Tax=Balaenoptera musculus TaxID=9771 RepID=A0A8C0D2U8_BALMU